MLVYTTTKKRMLRMIMIILAVFVGIAIGAAAIMNSINTSAAERKVPIYSVECGDNKIALTFDCAWGNSNTEELIKILQENNVKATLFVTGEFCDAYTKDVLKFFQAGHEIQNHSDKHIHVNGININDLIADTKECARKIEMITGVAPTLYRTPYGEYDNNVLTTLEGMDYQVVQWSVDSIDWEEPSAQTIVSRVCDNTKSGDILLFHNDLANTTEALPEVIKNLKKQGFTFVTANELLYDDSYYIDSNGRQIYEVRVSSALLTYSNNSLVNEAFETMRRNLTASEIYSLTGGANVEIINKITPLLSDAQITAIQNLSYEEIKAAFWNLVAAVNEYGAGVSENALTEAPETTGTPEVTTDTPPETTPQSDPVVTTTGDTTDKGVGETAETTTAGALDKGSEETAAATTAGTTDSGSGETAVTTAAGEEPKG